MNFESKFPGPVRRNHRTCAVLLTALITQGSPVQAEAAQPSQWTAAWTAAPCAEVPGKQGPPRLFFHGDTVREIVHTTIGGDEVRVRVSNAFGTEALSVASASIGIRTTGGSLQPGTLRALTFGGRPGSMVPAGSYVLSDPVRLDTPALADIAVSLYFAQPTAATTLHYAAQQTSYVVSGDRTAALDLVDAKTIRSWPFLSAVEISSPVPQAAIVALGSSITDGFHSTVDANHRWPDYLARRLQHTGRLRHLAILNQGMGGNRVLHDGGGAFGPVFGPSASARFDRDVLGQAGVKYLILFEGGNDISQPGSDSAPLSEAVTAEDLIAGLGQLVERAHEHGIAVLAGTLTPFAGMTSNVYNEDREAIRAAVNAWMRSSPIFDGVIDFDAAVRDPLRQTRLLPAYDSGDHLHPNDAGYEAMASIIDTQLFQHNGLRRKRTGHEQPRNAR